jgi:hypothetical protein
VNWGGLGQPYGQTTMIADVTDGLSNTAAWSERLAGMGYKTTDNNGGPILDPLTPSTNIYYVPIASALPNFASNPGVQLGQGQMMMCSPLALPGV